MDKSVPRKGGWSADPAVRKAEMQRRVAVRTANFVDKIHKALGEDDSGALRVWTPRFDMSTIPEKIFASEKARRNNAKVKHRSGGVIWGEHVPDYSRCRCPACQTARVELRAERAKQPKRRRGRPAKVSMAEHVEQMRSLTEATPVATEAAKPIASSGGVSIRGGDWAGF